MSLSARLDRLRHPTSLPNGGDAAASAGRTGRPVPATRTTTPDPARLASLLGGREVDGLVCVASTRSLSPDDAALHALPQVHDVGVTDWVYLDTETSGLSGGVGNLAFMLGLARQDGDGRLDMRQYVLGRCGAERQMLRALAEWLGPDSVLVSYNGKCFDVPLLVARLRLHEMDVDLARLRHLDLVHPVRRAFRRHWPDCRLQTAERRLLDLHRVDDLPGARAPAAWQAWLRDGSTEPLAGVLCHNAQDVASLALLHRRLTAVYAGSADAAGVDHAAVGAAWHEAGDPSRARRIWERAGSRLDSAGRLALAANYRRAGQWSRATALWSQLFAEGDSRAALELSKYYEHRCRDLAAAARYAGWCVPEERSVRLARLRRKQTAGPQLPLWPRHGGERDVVAGGI